MSELSRQFLVKAKESSSLRQSRISREVLKVDRYIVGFHVILMKNTGRRMKTKAFLLVFNRVNNEAGLSEKLQQLNCRLYVLNRENTSYSPPPNTHTHTMTSSGFLLTHPVRE